MNEMKILMKRTDDLVPYGNNPRHNDNAVEAVAASIQEFGFKVPIVIDKKGVIVTGHTRLKAAELLGLDEVPCIMADDLDEEQVKAFRLADNKVSELATWDYERLEMELEGISLDMEPFGFGEFEDEDLSEFESSLDDDRYTKFADGLVDEMYAFIKARPELETTPNAEDSRMDFIDDDLDRDEDGED